MSITNPILITGADRSGSTFVARVFDICGAFTGDINVMYENIMVYPIHHHLVNKNAKGCHMPDLKTTNFPKDWKNTVSILLQLQGYDNMPFLYKDAAITQLWPMWHSNFPDARWIIVRRKPTDIIQSCIKTGYMKRFKIEKNRKEIGVHSEHEGWRWWISQYEKRFVDMIKAGINHKIVWPERMADGDFEQMKEAVEWAGLTWNPKIEEVITPLFRNRNVRK